VDVEVDERRFGHGESIVLGAPADSRGGAPRPLTLLSEHAPGTWVHVEPAVDGVRREQRR
jgi:hypothetical protein